MTATVTQDYAEHPTELDAELAACGILYMQDVSLEKRLCDLTNQYVVQWNKLVTETVPTDVWVRAAHIKAMAKHARQTIFVLDADESGLARVQAYAYRTIEGEGQGTWEKGCVDPISTPKAVQVLQDLIGEGILPIVLVLRWRELGNHFQVITYDPERYAFYSSQPMVMAQRRNTIYSRFGWVQLDYSLTNPELKAKLASTQLRAIRKAAKDKIKVGKITRLSHQSKGRIKKADQSLRLGSVLDSVDLTLEQKGSTGQVHGADTDTIGETLAQPETHKEVMVDDGTCVAEEDKVAPGDMGMGGCTTR
ncbi:hypothetical protein DVH05_016939 [Phytophthora capsici]|nr:hypothetical protein DVH05_016939 [Phytophthora capsici]